MLIFSGKRLLIVAFVGVLLFVGFGRNQSLYNDNTRRLTMPTFVRTASADESAVSAIADEAGISAWFKTESTIDLDDVRVIYRTIEDETDDYIIGSVPIAGYLEVEDVHVYISTDGWFLAYYLNTEPAGKVVDWIAYDNSGDTVISTKFETVLTVASAAAGIVVPDITHYDFRYPDAATLMLIAEASSANGRTFSIELPTGFTFYERSWSKYGNGGALRLNGVNVDGSTTSPSGYGTLTPAQLLPNTLHQLETYAPFGGLALVYSE